MLLSCWKILFNIINYVQWSSTEMVPVYISNVIIFPLLLIAWCSKMNNSLPKMPTSKSLEPVSTLPHNCKKHAQVQVWDGELILHFHLAQCHRSPHPRESGESEKEMWRGKQRSESERSEDPKILCCWLLRWSFAFIPSSQGMQATSRRLEKAGSLQMKPNTFPCTQWDWS